MNTLTLRNHATAKVSFAVVSWALAAVGVAAAHQLLEPVSPAACVAAKVLIILAAASGFALLTSRLTIELALFAGVAWAALCIVAEVAAAATAHHGWFDLLGSPSRPLLRDLLLVTWIFAPAVFARRR
jgi:hypothetical protein